MLFHFSLSFAISAAFLLSSSATSPKSESGVGLTQFISVVLPGVYPGGGVAEPVPPPVPCPHCASSVGSRASSAIVRPLILDSISDTTPFSFRTTCADNFQDSHPYRKVDMAHEFIRRRRRPFVCSLEAVRSRLRSACLDQALAK